MPGAFKKFQSRNRASRPSDEIVHVGAVVGVDMFQSRNRASRPSDLCSLCLFFLCNQFQSRNRASRPSDHETIVWTYGAKTSFNPAIGLPGLLTCSARGLLLPLSGVSIPQ